ncbi:MAG: hypothetical protein R3C11_22920 [Planctomycetaceae bacterium]
MRLIEEVCENVRPQMEQKEITFDIHVPPKLSKINADKDKIVAALVNLLGNAAKYTMEGGEVRFRVEQVRFFHSTSILKIPVSVFAKMRSVKSSTSSSEVTILEYARFRVTESVWLTPMKLWNCTAVKS